MTKQTQLPAEGVETGADKFVSFFVAFLRKGQAQIDRGRATQVSGKEVEDAAHRFPDGDRRPARQHSEAGENGLRRPVFQECLQLSGLSHGDEQEA